MTIMNSLVLQQQEDKIPTTGKIKCKIEGIKLKDLDFFTHSDPICIIEEKVGNEWKEVGRTEKLDNNLNPVFEIEPEFNYKSFE